MERLCWRHCLSPTQSDEFCRQSGIARQDILAAALARPAGPLQIEAKRGKKLVPTLAVIFMLIACFIAGEYAVPALLPPGWTAEAFSSETSAAGSLGTGMLSGNLEEFRLRRLEATVREGLEEYLAVKGTYPFTLEILVVRKFVTRNTISRVHQAGIVYRMGDSGQDYSLARD